MGWSESQDFSPQLCSTWWFLSPVEEGKTEAYRGKAREVGATGRCGFHRDASFSSEKHVHASLDAAPASD